MAPDGAAKDEIEPEKTQKSLALTDLRTPECQQAVRSFPVWLSFLKTGQVQERSPIRHRSGYLKTRTLTTPGGQAGVPARSHCPLVVGRIFEEQGHSA